MGTLTEDKKHTEKKNTESVHKVRTALHWAIGIFTGLVVVLWLISMLSGWQANRKEASKVSRAERVLPPLTTDKRWPAMGIDPEDTSMIFTVSALARPVFRGSGFEVWCVYQKDGRKEKSPLLDRCPYDMGIFQAYLVNTTSNVNVVDYAFELIRAQ